MMLATILGVDFDPNLSYDERKDLWRMSDKIVTTRNVTQSAIGDRDGLWSSVVAAAVFVDFPTASEIVRREPGAVRSNSWLQKFSTARLEAIKPRAASLAASLKSTFGEKADNHRRQVRSVRRARERAPWSSRNRAPADSRLMAKSKRFSRR